jgi:hypothetical protein
LSVTRHFLSLAFQQLLNSFSTEASVWGTGKGAGRLARSGFSAFLECRCAIVETALHDIAVQQHDEWCEPTSNLVGTDVAGAPVVERAEGLTAIGPDQKARANVRTPAQLVGALIGGDVFDLAAQALRTAQADPHVNRRTELEAGLDLWCEGVPIRIGSQVRKDVENTLGRRIDLDLRSNSRHGESLHAIIPGPIMYGDSVSGARARLIEVLSPGQDSQRAFERAVAAELAAGALVEAGESQAHLDRLRSAAVAVARGGNPPGMKQLAQAGPRDSLSIPLDVAGASTVLKRPGDFVMRVEPRSSHRCWVALLGLVWSITAMPESAVALISAGSFPSSSPRGVSVVDGVAYLADRNSRLRIVDVSDPSATFELGNIDVHGWRIEVVGSIAYLLDTFGLHILDVSDPSTPMELSSIEWFGAAYGLEIVGNLAYISSDRDASFRIVDVSNPAQPREIGALGNPVFPGSTRVAGDIAFVADRFAGLRSIDVSNPMAPFIRSTLASVDGHKLEVVENYAYVLGRRGLTVVDITNPNQMNIIGDLYFIGLPEQTFASGDRLYVADRSYLKVIDISDPANPVGLGQLSAIGSNFGIDVVGNFAYLASDVGLVVVDLTHETTPSQIAAWDVEAGVWDLAVEGPNAFVAAGSGGLRILDVSDPQPPTNLGVLSAPAHRVKVDANVVYVIDNSFGLRVVDVTHPSTPVEIGSLAMADASDIWVDDGLAYITGGTELRLIEVSRPSRPQQVAVLGGFDASQPIAVFAKIAYVGDRNGVQLVDVSHPRHPIRLSSVAGYGAVTALAVTNSHLYFVEGYRLWTVDVSNPNSPEITDVFRGRIARDAVVAGDFLYLGTGAVQLFDISKPDTPRDLGHLGRSSKFAISANRAYLQLGPTLSIFELGPDYNPDLDVAIDIRPHSPVNWILPLSRGLIGVALLGSGGFDVARVDASSVVFGPTGALPIDGGAPDNIDYNGDGLADRLFQYRTVETGIALGDRYACLSGSTNSGAFFRGCDKIVTHVACGIGYELAMLLPLFTWLRRVRGLSKSRP